MLRSMYAGVSGLRSHQTMMDVVGNNIANVNTVGFKSSSTVFQDVLNQVIRGAGAPSEEVGGTNPAQVGLGVRVAGTNTNLAAGGSQTTGRATDIAILGDGFFAVRRGNEQLYTRAGSFNFDSQGQIVTPDGLILQGWMADLNGVVNTNAPTADMRLPMGQMLAPNPTSTINMGGNIPVTYGGTPLITSVNIVDQQGIEYPVTFSWAQTGPNAWDMVATTPDFTPPLGGPDVTLLTQAVTFNAATGRPTPATATLPLAALPGTFAAAITVDFGSTAADGLTQFDGPTSLGISTQDGFQAGSLQSFTFGESGEVVGVFSNGRTRMLGQLSLTTFNNPGGLEKVGGSTFRETVNSGLAVDGVPGTGGRGTTAAAMLEMSNVDLAAEFTNLIVAQRGFQANSRVISTSDELLQELVNLKR